ncbi:hypothetical protein B0H13DRAFT_1850048 [Mycena leptocephala]|nr:hypothetical protein B0H13DRAFT_1850048 [Mycena leptocephala]
MEVQVAERVKLNPFLLKVWASKLNIVQLAGKQEREVYGHAPSPEPPCVWIDMESPELVFKSTRAAKINLKRQFEPKFRWLSSQQDPVKIQLEMIAQWLDHAHHDYQAARFGQARVLGGSSIEVENEDRRVVPIPIDYGFDQHVRLSTVEDLFTECWVPSSLPPNISNSSIGRLHVTTFPLNSGILLEFPYTVFYVPQNALPPQTQVNTCPYVDPVIGMDKWDGRLVDVIVASLISTSALS